MLTLIEASKLVNNDTYKQGVMMKFAESSEILRVLMFEGIPGDAVKYNVEETLPGIAFRGINESFTESTGIINPKVETLVIGGGDLDVDTSIIKTRGMIQRTYHEAMKIKALALFWTKTFFKGDSAVDPREFDGLQTRLTGTALISNGTAGLKLSKLDEAIDAVDNPTHVCMNKAVRRHLTVAARTAAVGGNITYTIDEFGRQVARYNDLPILIIEQDNAGTEILGFTEASSTTSIYILSIGVNRVQGIQNGGMDVRDLGELDSKPALRTRIEWLCGFGVFAPKSAARISGITDAAVTA
jgi:hypothetical protein